MKYLTRYLRRPVPQSEPLAGQVANSAGGHAWRVNDWTRLQRFLVLGSEGGTFYIRERPLTRENAKAVERCIAADGSRAVREIVAVSRDGRAPKNDPAIFALAMAAGLGDETRGAPRSTHSARCAGRERTCSSSRSTSRRSAAGAARCGVRWAAGTQRATWSRSRTRR